MDKRIGLILLFLLSACSQQPKELIRGNVVQYHRGTSQAECVTAYGHMVVTFEPDLEGHCNYLPGRIKVQP